MFMEHRELTLETSTCRHFDVSTTKLSDGSKDRALLRGRTIWHPSVDYAMLT
jgi:hypothetical protein